MYYIFSWLKIGYSTCESTQEYIPNHCTLPKSLMKIIYMPHFYHHKLVFTHLSFCFFCYRGLYSSAVMLLNWSCSYYLYDHIDLVILVYRWGTLVFSQFYENSLRTYVNVHEILLHGHSNGDALSSIWKRLRVPGKPKTMGCSIQTIVHTNDQKTSCTFYPISYPVRLWLVKHLILKDVRHRNMKETETTHHPIRLVQVHCIFMCHDFNKSKMYNTRYINFGRTEFREVNKQINKKK